MAGNQYDQTLEELEPPAESPQAPNPYLDTLEQMETSQQRALRQAADQAVDSSPDRAAEAIRLGQQLGLPADVVERNFDTIKKRATLEGSPFADMLRDTPQLAQWASDPENAKVAHDDMENLGALEWLLTAPSRSFAQGVDQVRFGQLKTKSLFEPLSQEEQDQLNAYKFGMEKGGALGAGASWFRKAITGGAQQLPNLFGAGLYAAKYGAAGALTVGAAGAAVGTVVPGAGTMAGATAGAGYGARAGVLYGASKFGFQLEAGNAYDEYQAFRDENGQPLDDDVAKAAAIATGAMNAGLEGFGFEVLLKSIPGLKQLGALGVRSAVKQALTVPTVRAALKEAVLSYGKTLTLETSTEVAQRAVTILSGELAKTASGQNIPHRSATSVLEDLTNEGVGAVQSFAFTVAAGPALHVANQVAEAKRAQQGSDFFKALGAQVAQSKLTERLPGKMQEFVTNATKDGPIANVYIPADSWVTYWQGQGLDPAAVAKEVLGSSDALEQAQRTGEDLVIPTGRYAATLAGTSHNAALADEMRLAPDMMNAREARVFEEGLKALSQAEPAPASAVRQNVLEQLVAAGVPEETAGQYADLFDATIGTMASRAGVAPEELLADYGITIKRETEASVTQPAPAPTEAAPLGTEAAPASEGAAVAPAQATQQPQLEEEIPGLAALEEGLKGTELELVTDEQGVGANGSGESAASLEAQSRLAGMKARSESFGVYDRAGRFRPLIGADAVDYQPQRGETFGILSPDGFRVMTDNGGKVPANNQLAPAAAVGETEGTDAGEAAGTEAGLGLRDGSREQPETDTGGSAEAGSDGARTERQRLSPPAFDEIFQRKPAEENAARFTPEVVRELERIADELDTFPFIERTWHWLGETEKKTGNAAGGEAIVTAGAAGAEVYHDIIAYAPVGMVTSGKRKGQPARQASGTRGKVLSAVRQAIELRDIRTGLAEGAVRVAERRAIDDYSIISFPALPPSWGREASELFTETLSAAIDEELLSADMLDEDAMERDILDPDADVDTSFNVEEFNQGLFDNLETEQLTAPATETEKVDTLDTGEQQPRLPGAGQVREADVATPEFDAPFSLTAPVAKTKGQQKTLFQSVGAGAGFEQWFGNSVMRTTMGRPMVLYHGTPATFDAFNGESPIYLSVSRDEAFDWGEHRLEGSNDFESQVNVLELFARIETPLRVEEFDDIIGWDMEDVRRLEAEGYDGAIFEDYEGTIVVAFRPNQVKSATDNRGSYSSGDDRIFYQQAFHGSPHIFDKFSLHAIGTGEGAQAYGWGLYFASRRETADYYRKVLSDDPVPIFRGLTEEENATLPPWIRYGLTAKGLQNPLDRLDQDIADFKQRIADNIEKINPTPRSADEVARMRADGWGDLAETPEPHAQPWVLEEQNANSQRIIDVLEKLKAGGSLEELPQQTGRVYVVDIPDDDRMLSWDLPASQQSPHVQAALRQLGLEWKPFKTKTAKQILNWLDGPTAQALAREDVGIREALRQAYVIASNATVARPAWLEQWQWDHQGYFNQGMVDPRGEQLYSMVQELARKRELEERVKAGDKSFSADDWKKRPEQASRLLNAHGIAGIRYLDGGSRNQGGGTQNFVIFDDSLVSIQEFYQTERAGKDITTADARQWADELKEKIGPDLEALELYVTNAGDIKLDTLAVRRGAARQGLGSRVMQELTRYADANGRRIILSLAQKGYQPIEGGEKTTSSSRLEKFYRGFGFVKNSGRYKDFTIREGMYREPTVRPTQPLPVAAPVLTETPGFRRWFGSSKVVDENGQPKIAHHGTARGDRIGNVFRKDRATSGPMAYFTESKAIAAKYSQQKVDTSLEQPESYTGWFKFKPKGARTEITIDRAWWHLTREEQQTVIERLPMVGYENPDAAEGRIVYGSESITSQGHIDYLLKQEARGNGLLAAVQLWLESGSLFGDEARFLEVLEGLGLGGRFRLDDPHATHSQVFDVYLSIQNPLETDNIPQALIDKLEANAERQARPESDFGADPWDKRTRDPIQWVQQLKEDYAKGENSFVWSSIPDWVTATLKTFGYDGIKDSGGKMGGDAHVVWIPFEPTQIKSVDNQGTFDPKNPNILKQEKRGAIRFGRNRQVTISLFEKADLSTFLHESGHLFLEIAGDLADRVAAVDPAQLSEQQRKFLADYAGILQYLGVDNRDAIQTEHHETFARSFEAYLMTGQAPTLRLQSAFSRFRAWLLGVYRALKNLNVTLTPEVTGIFDRLLASDAAIAEAQQRRGVEAMFTTAADAGMSEQDFALYRETVAQASRTAREKLDARLMAEVRREQEDSYKARRTEVQAEVETAVYAEPVYQALAAIRNGTTPNGDPLVEGLETKPLRLSKELIADRFGKERLKRLPSFTYVKDAGVDPDTVAQMFGFSSSDELLTALENAPPMRQVIQQQTDRRMLAEYGSLLLDGTVHEAAQAAIANEDRDAIIRAELRALNQLRRTAKPFVQAGEEKLAAERRERAYERRWFEAEAKLREAIAAGKKQVVIDELTAEVQNLRRKARGGAALINAAIPPADVIRDNAKARIAGMKIGDIRADVFWSASRRAAQQAIDRAARQDFEGAIKAKQQELVNLALYREAERALEDVKARVKFAKDLGKPAARARLGLAGTNYQDQVDGILDAYEFAKVPQKALERRASLARFLAGLEASGLPVPADMPPELLEESRRTNYQNLTVEELVGVTDGLKMIVHLARLKTKLLKAQDEREFAEVRTSIVDAIRKHSPTTELPLEFREAEDRKRRFADWFASHSKISQLAQALDGYVDGGPVWTNIIKPLNDAANQEAERNATAGEAYRAILARFYTADERAAFGAKLFIPAIGASLSREARLAVALNWGNETSRDRLTNDPRRKWNRNQVEAILATLDKRDWDFVQATFDYLDTFWPDIAAKQERVTGVAPEKVEAAVIKTQFGDYKGGYYPLMYDARLNVRSQQLEAASEAKTLLSAAFVSSTTKRGHVEARKSNVRLSVRLDLGVAFQHMQQVIHDLTHHEALIDVQRILRDPAVSNAILETKGDIVYQQFTRALQDIAAGNVNGPRPTILDKAATFARQGTQLSLLGLNLWTAAQQPLGLFNGMSRVGVRYVARGMRRWLRDAAHMEHTVRWINSVSPMMRNRLDTATQDLSDLRQELKRSGGWFDKLVRTVTADHVTQSAILEGYLWHIGVMQRVADVPTWLGQYEKSKDAGETEERAIALADQAVLDSQGGGQIKDLAQIQRGGPVARLFMTFYSYGNTVFNATARAAGRTSFKSPVQVLEFMGHLGLLYAAPAMMAAALARATGRDGGDDDDLGDYFGDVAKEMLSSALNTMVGIRELAGLIPGRSGEVRGYSGPAGARVIQLAYSLGQQAQQGELDEAFFKAANRVGGILFSYPSAQLERTIDGYLALEEGRTNNPAALLFGGPPKNEKR